jgi:hypothetical protein
MQRRIAQLESTDDVSCTLVFDRVVPQASLSESHPSGLARLPCSIAFADNGDALISAIKQ